MLCCMIRNTVKTMPYFYEIVWNYDYLHPFINTKTAIKNDLLNHATKQENIMKLKLKKLFVIQVLVKAIVKNIIIKEK